MPSRILIRPAMLYDIEEISRIEKETFPDPWSKNLLLNQIKDQENIIYVLVDEYKQKLIAYSMVYEGYDEFSLDNIAIDKDYRGKGLGNLLMKKIFEIIGNKPITLEVRYDNKEAIGLYEKYDFKVEGIRKNYYGQGIDALIMWRR